MPPKKNVKAAARKAPVKAAARKAPVKAAARKAPVKAAARKAPAKAAGKKKELSFAESTADEASKSVQTTHHVKFAAAEKTKGKATAVDATKKKPTTEMAAALRQSSGIVTAASVRKAGKRERPHDDDDEHVEEEDEETVAPQEAEDDDAVSLVDDDSDAGEDDSASEANLSDLADDESSDDEDTREGAAEDDSNPFVRAKRTGKKLQYKVLRLRFLPQEFQEPQLFKFLGQFGAEVFNCFCVRSRRTHQSKGIAYVQFSTEDVLPLVVEECNGMALGGRAVRARIVTLRRAMPSKEKVTKRRRLAYAYKTKGAPLKQHSVLRKNPVGLLIKAARTESANNAHLAALGVDFATHFFTEQLKTVPQALITKNTKVLMDARTEEKKATPAAGSPAKTPAKGKKTAAAAATPSSSTKKKSAPTPKKSGKASPARGAAAKSKAPAGKAGKAGKSDGCASA